MNYRSLFTNLKYRALVRSAKRNYHVLESSDFFVLISPQSQDKGNYQIVNRKALNYVLRELGGSRKITSGGVLEACRRSKFLKDRFSALNTLYALVGIKKAEIIGTDGRALAFSIRKGRV